MDTTHVASHLTSSKHWLRLFFMLIFAFVLQIVSVVMWLLVIVQFLCSLITGEDNASLRQFGHTLSIYIFHTLKFLTYASEEKPFPFADWPQVDDITKDAS